MPTHQPASSAPPWSELPLVGLFSNFLRTWNYSPRTQWLDHFITINWNGGDADLEQHVLGQAGSYGLQLGRIIDALEVLTAHADLSDLTDEERHKLALLQELTLTKNRAIAEYRANPTAYQSPQ